MGGTINNLENLLKQPSGCGEQNMINFAPAIFTTLYLEQTKQLSASYKKKAYKFYNSGYQNQLKWEKYFNNFRTLNTVSIIAIYNKSDRSLDLYLFFIVTKEMMAHSVLLEEEISSEVYGSLRLCLNALNRLLNLKVEWKNS